LLLQFSISNELLIYSFEAPVLFCLHFFFAFNLPWWSSTRQILNAQNGSKLECKLQSSCERPRCSRQDAWPELKPPKRKGKRKGN
jgi:hypothetical protein